MSHQTPLEGEIELALTWNGRIVTDASVRSLRPHVASMLRGLTLADAVERIPQVFSLCGEAQSVATQGLRQLLEEGTLDGPSLRSHSARIRLETLREHLWRLALDWMPMAGLPPRMDELRALLTGRDTLLAQPEALMGWAAALRREWFGGTEEILADPRSRAETDAPLRFLDPQWLETSPARLAELGRRLQPELAGLGLADTDPASGIDLPCLLEHMRLRLDADPGFAQSPDFEGRPLEMGPLARMLATRNGPEQGAAATFRVDAFSRFSARVAELWERVREIEAGRAGSSAMTWVSDGDTAAIALEMARGVLMHRIRLERGRVAEYAIVAPTEWNFHPGGILRAGLRAVPATSRDALERAVRQQVMALDPCVRYRLEIRHA